MKIAVRYAMWSGVIVLLAVLAQRRADVPAPVRAPSAPCRPVMGEPAPSAPAVAVERPSAEAPRREATAEARRWDAFFRARVEAAARDGGHR